MKILITGTAGFIGSHLARELLSDGHIVIGIDNHNNYYDPQLKEDRLKLIIDNKNYNHYRIALEDKESIKNCFKKFEPEVVVNLAAQAGVRYSIENPFAYLESNLCGFLNIIENCKRFNVKHLIYASTSSVYGANSKMPFSELDSTNHPLSFYAATKKANELMAHTYSYLFDLPTTGLRFFTVYGPWGRPDMALFKFTKSILEEKEFDVYNFGNHTRDFTYVDDIVKGISTMISLPAQPNIGWDGNNPDPSSSLAPWKIYNIGNNNPIKLMSYIEVLESLLKRKAKINFLPKQPGDVPDTFADVSKLETEFNYKPSTTIQEGISKFIEWYLEYYEIKL